MKLNHSEIKVVARLYLTYGVPLDQLPYTETIEYMLTEFAKQTQRTLTLREFWTSLLSLRKAGKLGKTNARKKSATILEAQ